MTSLTSTPTDYSKLAALFSSANICQFLGRLGVKADASFDGHLPLHYALYYDAQSDASKVINTVRFFIQDRSSVELMGTVRMPRVLDLPVEALVWIWNNRAGVFDCFDCQDVSAFEHICVSGLVSQLGRSREAYLAIEYLEGDFAPTLRRMLTRSSLRFLEALFTPWHWLFPWGWLPKSRVVSDSYKRGKTFLDIIERLGLDAEKCVRKEMDNYPDGILYWGIPRRNRPYQRVVFKYIQKSGWTLGWEWIYDAETSGYLIVSEFDCLAANTLHSQDFPFAEHSDECTPQQTIRFERRMAAKARKELARTGLKQPRSRMPGSWVG